MTQANAEWTPGHRGIAPHPRAADVFERVERLGYRLFYREQPTPGLAGGRQFFVEGRKGDEVAAKATFTIQSGVRPWCQRVDTVEGHRGRGLANAMYVLAEMAFGRPLWDFWASTGSQAEGGKRLWAQPNRPFGNPFPL